MKIAEFIKKIKLSFQNLIFKINFGKIFYINGSETLPPPLTKLEEEEIFKLLEQNEPSARKKLIEHNLRLVVYIAKKFGIILPSLLTIVIWFEMFSTEISNIYSLCKRITYSFKIPYKISVLFIIIISIPFTFIGFTNLIRYLYPPFGAISFIFVFGCILKYFDIK